MDPITLLKKMVSFQTINPPGNESELAGYIGGLLEPLGFQTEYYEFAPKRTTLIARFSATLNQASICFTGHLDVVSLGETAWTKDPFAGEIEGDKIFGRGTSDMKAGIAAMISMAMELHRTKPALLEKIMFVFTAGEETCCEGAYHITGLKNVLGRAKVMVVGEPTSNYPLVGHKGSVRFDITTFGKAAHASMPELGDNAIYKAARVIAKLESFDFKIAAHPLLGSPTLCIGRISGGKNINVVPDRTCMGVDIRTIPGQNHGQIKSALESALGSNVEVILLEVARSVASDPEDQWIKLVFSIMKKLLGTKIEAKTAAYFTDASVLYKALGNPPTILLGPGEAHMAHSKDEFCHISKIDEAIRAYLEIVTQTK
ncbi:MAG: M20 family metallopeptidase [Desulfotignum sp.]|nr:M20 family metallopeptidase [Desulfotignum sp.]